MICTLNLVLFALFKDLVNFEKQWSGFFSSMDLESHLSILELSEAQAGEVHLELYHPTIMWFKKCSTAQEE